jgi:alpha-ketoglutarate-dependent taurine dioxygenase/acyl carrier protein
MHILHVNEDDAANSLELFGSNQNDYVATLSTHGAILFRGLRIKEACEFAAFGQHLVTKWMDYRDRASKRSVVRGPILTSTDTPSSYPIPLHSESSFTAEWPQKVLFCCRVPPSRGGRTPIADTRRIYADLDPALREKFERLGVMYHRNFSPGVGMDWRDVFQQKSAAALEAYCELAKIQTEWVSDEHLRTVQVRPAVSKHPKTQEWVWFNHALALSQYALDPNLRETLLRQVGEEGLPHNTYFGNGEPISEQEFELIRQAHDKNTVLFDWQQGDVLLLDNMLMTHGREPFSGDREILAALADPLTWTEIGQNTRLPQNKPCFDSSQIQVRFAPVAASSGQEDFGIWLNEILQNEFELEVEDLNLGFFDAGGDSLTAVELLDRTISEFGLEFSLDDFLDAPSMSEFARGYTAKLASHANA